MAKIAYILLCHKDPLGIIAQAKRLTAAGDFIALHFDGRGAAADFAQLEAALGDDPQIALVRQRVKCGWGEWSLVEATLRALRLAEAQFPQASHFYLLSGDCWPIKSAEYARAFLDKADVDYIECCDFFDSDWIKTGIKAERLIYRHYFNERSQKVWFYRALALQQKLGLKRAVPQDLAIQVGSQWWCLRRLTVEKLLRFIKERPDVLRFFRRSWIPDETFFQTLVAHLLPGQEIDARPLTFLMFSDYGMPVTFYNDQYDLLLAQDYLFARKISEDALALREKLGALYAAKGQDFAVADHGANLYRYLTGRGRAGRRYAPRFWQNDLRFGQNQQLFVIASKKWHLGRRLARHLAATFDIPQVGYLFNDEGLEDVPDLGGIESTLDKRTRHRRALLRMLYDHWQSDQLLICVDPASLELLQDFMADRIELRLLELDSSFTEAELIDHAKRQGLASETSPAAALALVLPTLRADLRHDSARIAKLELPAFHRLRESATLEEKTKALADFLGQPKTAVETIAGSDWLFKD